MATLLIKSLGIAGGLASAIATGGGIYYLTSSNPATKEDNSNKQSESTKLPPITQAIEKNQTISSLLKGKKLLTKNSEDDSKGTAPGQSFKKEYASKLPEDPWKFVDGEQNKENPETLTSFKKQCVTLGEQKVSGINDLVFVTVDKYCTTATGND